MACRINRKRQWAGRILLESFSHPYSYFVTLTYDPEHPEWDALQMTKPGVYSVSKDHLSRFMKRLRRYTGEKFRFFACGEYGERYGRPHYHLIIYSSIEPVRMEQEVNKAWTLKKKLIGYVTVSELNPERAQYVAQYTTKKLTSAQLYLDGRLNEFAIMSKKPGLGRSMIIDLAKAYAKYHTGLMTSSGSGDAPVSLAMSTERGLLRILGRVWPMDRYIREEFHKELAKVVPDYDKFDRIFAILEAGLHSPDFNEFDEAAREEAKKKAQSKYGQEKYARLHSRVKEYTL